MGYRTQGVAIAALILGVALALTLAVPAAAEEEVAGEYAEEEMTDCLDCHDETEKYPVLPILATQHAVKADARTPLAQTHECQTCHGPSAAHMEDEKVAPAILFGPDHPADAQNEVCLGCHQNGNRINWQSSTHAGSGVACTSCHAIHVKEDRVLVKDRRPDTPVNRPSQMAVCFECHQDKRADIHKASSHPLRDGLIACSDCHNPHGGIGPTNLRMPTLNETCYTCHAEKRGPYLWEHAPVSENCGICHTPHGSNHPALLASRLPFLCQQCHVAGSHPKTDYAGPDYQAPFAGSGFPVMDRRVGARSCMNCHTEVHGSNHPSGVRWTR